MLDDVFRHALDIVLGLLCAVVCLLSGGLGGYYLFKFSGVEKPQRRAFLFLGVPLAIGGFFVGYFVGVHLFEP